MTHSDKSAGPAICAAMAIEDLPVPHVASERGRCTGCDREVWIDPRSLALVKQIAREEGNGEFVINCGRCLEMALDSVQRRN
jgi:hypothetical protein